MSDPQGLAFDPVAEDYERGRPGWPAEMLHGIDAEAVLDLGAGTGKLTELLAAHYPVVIAVEPLASMRAILRRKLPQVDVEPGSAERIPLDDGSVDAVFVADAFHWFDSKAAAFEIARVLRPNGKLVVAFNDWRSEFEPPIGDAARAALEAGVRDKPPGGAAKIATGEWKRGIEAAPFGPLVERVHEHVDETDREGVAAHYLSMSPMAMLTPDEREALRTELIAVLPDAKYRLQLAARVFTAVRR